MLEKVTPVWLFCLSSEFNTPLSLSLAPLHTQHTQHKQQIVKKAMTPTTIPIILPTLREFDSEPLVLLYLSGLLNSQENESTSRQKASLMSALEALLGSMEDRRLLERVTLGEAESVALSALVSRLVSVSVSFLVSRFSKVLLTASRMTGDGLVSYVMEEQSTSRKS